MRINLGGNAVKFVSEPIQPVAGYIGTSNMVKGGPGIPYKFIWRDQEYVIEKVIFSWHETGGCRYGGGEQYTRKHWFHIKTVCGREMKLYFERQPKSEKKRFDRWWLYSASIPPNDISEKDLNDGK